MVNVKLMNARLIDRAVRIYMERHPDENDYQNVVEKLKKSSSIKAAEERRASPEPSKGGENEQEALL